MGKFDLTLNPKPGTGATTQRVTVEATTVADAKRLAEAQYGARYYVRTGNAIGY